MSDLEAAMPAVQVMSEYVRAVRLLGHPTPEPSRLHSAYTAEDGMDLLALDADARALSAAAVNAEEALLLQERARRALDGTWWGAGGQAAADQLRRHADAADAVVDGLRSTAAALAELRNRLRQLVDAKIEATVEVEARGMRPQWLGAARAVATGAGDRSAASELVDAQVAPFVAHDIGVDWVSSMRDTEAAIRQAYRDAATAHGAAVFDGPVPFALPRTEPVAAEPLWAPLPAPAAVTAPVGYSPGPAPPAPEPVAGPVPAAAAPPGIPTAAPPGIPSAPVDPGGPFGGGASPAGSGMSGMSGLSGLGRSFADMLGGLLGSGGDVLGDNLGGTDDLDLGPDDDPEDLESDGSTEDEEPGDEERGDEEPEDEEPEDEEPGDDPVEPGDDEDGEPADAAESVAPVEPVISQPEPSAPTPVPDPPVGPAVEAPVESAAETPCEIAADELPQAGP